MAMLKRDVFFKSYELKVLLGLQTIYFCPVCSKVILEGEELPQSSLDNSVCCDQCSAWFHFKCVDIENIEEN